MPVYVRRCAQHLELEGGRSLQNIDFEASILATRVFQIRGALVSGKWAERLHAMQLFVILSEVYVLGASGLAMDATDWSFQSIS